MRSVFIDPLCIRVTEVGENGDRGLALARKWQGLFSAEPLIEPGVVVEGYKGPDKFKGWSFKMTLDRADSDLENLLTSGFVSIEIWTVNARPDRKRFLRFIPIVRNKWIHWVFPRTSWKRDKQRSRQFLGLSSTDPSPRNWNAPDGVEIPEGAFWKTSKKPPLI